MAAEESQMSVPGFVAIARAAYVALTLPLLGCHAWRPTSEPLPALTTSGGTTLRVTTRPSATGTAHRYVLFSARLEGDSLVGVADEEARRVGDGLWEQVLVEAGGRRVAVAAADVVEVSRLETSGGGTAVAVVIVVAWWSLPRGGFSP
jgi:hypothetical protein